VQNLSGGGLFREYEYKGDDYDAFLQQKKAEKLLAKSKQ
jgi:hypothetical protein